MRPHGVIVLIGKLFILKPKSQAYGYLHNLFYYALVYCKIYLYVVMATWIVLIQTNYASYHSTEFICYDDMLIVV